MKQYYFWFFRFSILKTCVYFQRRKISIHPISSSWHRLEERVPKRNDSGRSTVPEERDTGQVPLVSKERERANESLLIFNNRNVYDTVVSIFFFFFPILRCVFFDFKPQFHNNELYSVLRHAIKRENRKHFYGTGRRGDAQATRSCFVAPPGTERIPFCRPPTGYF